MFFNLHALDPFGMNPWKRSTESEIGSTFAGHQDWLTYLTAKVDPTARARGDDRTSAARLQTARVAAVGAVASVNSVNDIVDDVIGFLSGLQVPKMLPDGYVVVSKTTTRLFANPSRACRYGRVFHPRPDLHALIAKLVVFHMSNENRRQNGLDAAGEVSSPNAVCPIKGPYTEVGASAGQQIAIASYINPLGDPAAWARLLEYDTGKVSVLVANVLNGPDYIIDPAWKSVIDKAAASGKKILGYVRTGYLGVSQQKFTTRLGSNNLADWTS